MDGSAEGDDPAVEEPAHRWLGFVPAGRRRPHVAVCSCGWLSAPCSSAGLAAAAMDLHQDQRRA